MKANNKDFEKTLKEFKSLPKKDRKAIERQLSGLDKIGVTKALKQKIPPVATEEKEQPSDAGEGSPVDISLYSDWLRTHLARLLELNVADGQNYKVTQTFLTALPKIIEKTNSTLPETARIIEPSVEKSGFKAILSRLRREAT